MGSNIDHFKKALPSPLAIKTGRLGSWNHSRAGVHYQVGEIGNEVCNPNYVLERDGFPYIVIEFIENGELTIEVNSETLVMKQGSFFIYGPGAKIKVENRSEQPCVKYWIGIHAAKHSEINGLSDLLKDNSLYLLDQVPYVTMAKYFNLLMEFSEDESCWNSVRSIIESLIAFVISDSVIQFSTKELTNPIVELLDDLIHKEFKTLKKLDELEDKVGYNKSYLCQLYKKHTNTSLYQKLLQTKLEYACVLLETTEWKIMSVANEVGFDDHLHFSKFFHQKMGLTPTQYRSGVNSEINVKIN